MTGGDSYCYVNTIFNLEMTEAYFFLSAKGKFPLHDIEVQMVDSDLMAKLFPNSKWTPLTADSESKMNKVITRYPTVPFLASSAGRALDQISLTGRTDRRLVFNFYAMNGVWSQALELRLVNGKWMQAFTVARGVKVNKSGQLLYKYIEPGLPTP